MQKDVVSPNFKTEFIDTHNKYRTLHDVPSLALDDAISKVSQAWSAKIAAKGKMEHSQNKSYGENIYYFYKSDKNGKINGNDPVDLWYSEIKDYTFGKEKRPTGTGHFTQLVWKSSAKVGVGVSKDKKGYIYVVANYEPPGNIVGKYVENVLPPKKST